MAKDFPLLLASPEVGRAKQVLERVWWSPARTGVRECGAVGWRCVAFDPDLVPDGALTFLSAAPTVDVRVWYSSAADDAQQGALGGLIEFAAASAAALGCDAYLSFEGEEPVFCRVADTLLLSRAYEEALASLLATHSVVRVVDSVEDAVREARGQ